jgi:N-acyl homoserine lactone hydrolase
VRLPHSGNILLAIDAVMMQSQFTPDRKPGPRDDDAEKTRASTLKLLEIVKNENIALTVFGHDGTQWPHLKRSPDCYT